MKFWNLVPWNLIPFFIELGSYSIIPDYKNQRYQDNNTNKEVGDATEEAEKGNTGNTPIIT